VPIIACFPKKDSYQGNNTRVHQEKGNAYLIRQRKVAVPVILRVRKLHQTDVQEKPWMAGGEDRAGCMEDIAGPQQRKEAVIEGITTGGPGEKLGKWGEKMRNRVKAV